LLPGGQRKEIDDVPRFCRFHEFCLDEPPINGGTKKEAGNDADLFFEGQEFGVALAD
jgi:hypothetical protein